MWEDLKRANAQLKASCMGLLEIGYGDEIGNTHATVSISLKLPSTQEHLQSRQGTMDTFDPSTEWLKAVITHMKRHVKYNFDASMWANAALSSMSNENVSWEASKFRLSDELDCTMWQIFIERLGTMHTRNQRSDRILDFWRRTDWSAAPNGQHRNLVGLFHNHLVWEKAERSLQLPTISAPDETSPLDFLDVTIAYGMLDHVSSKLTEEQDSHKRIQRSNSILNAILSYPHTRSEHELESIIMLLEKGAHLPLMAGQEDRLAQLLGLFFAIAYSNALPPLPPIPIVARSDSRSNHLRRIFESWIGQHWATNLRLWVQAPLPLPHLGVINLSSTQSLDLLGFPLELNVDDSVERIAESTSILTVPLANSQGFDIPVVLPKGHVPVSKKKSMIVSSAIRPVAYDNTAGILSGKYSMDELMRTLLVGGGKDTYMPLVQGRMHFWKLPGDGEYQYELRDLTNIILERGALGVRQPTFRTWSIDDLQPCEGAKEPP